MVDILGQSALIVAITSFSLGASVLSKNVRNKLFLAFALLCALISGWSLFFFFDKLFGEGQFYRLHLLLNIWLAPAAIGFIRVMVRIEDSFTSRLFEVSLFTAATLTLSMAFHLDETNPLILQMIFFSPAFVITQMLHMMRVDRLLRRGLKRLPKIPTVGLTKRNFIYLGGLFVLLTSVMDHASWLGEDLGKVVPVIGNLGLSFYLFFMSQAITHQRMLNLEALISRFLVLLAVALLMTALFSLLLAWAENSVGLYFLNAFMASFLLLMLLEPLRKAVRYLTQILLTQTHIKLERTLRDAQRNLTGILDQGSLFQAILLTAQQILEPQWATLFVLRSDGTKYRRVRVLGPEPAMGTQPFLKEILASHPVLQYCERLQKRGDLPILLDQILENEIDRSASRQQREQLTGLIQGLRALGANLIIPLFDSGKILGFVTVLTPNPPQAWGSNWGLLSVIYPYFEQAGQTLRNMEVYVHQREKERLAALGEMAAGLAHEIRNPLGAIKGAAQLLDPSAERPDSQFLRVIIEEVDRLNRVVTQFLDYSKPQTTDFRIVDASQLISKCVELLQPGAPKNISLEFARPPSPARVMANPEQIQQVLLNLIQNSFKALDGKDGGLVRIGVDSDVSDAAREVMITVEDNGPGIKKEHLDKIFIPFFTTSPSGTGLGLSICQKIIEAHRGRMEVVCEEGRFTRFSVVLPVA